MAEVFQFPTNDVRNWTLIEESIREHLYADFDKKLIDHVVAETKVFYDKHNVELNHNFDLALPVGIPQKCVGDLVGSIQSSVQDIFEQVHQMMRNVIADRVMLEVRLYLSQR